jgi:hypothetical protein
VKHLTVEPSDRRGSSLCVTAADGYRGNIGGCSGQAAVDIPTRPLCSPRHPPAGASATGQKWNSHLREQMNVWPCPTFTNAREGNLERER